MSFTIIFAEEKPQLLSNAIDRSPNWSINWHPAGHRNQCQRFTTDKWSLQGETQSGGGHNIPSINKYSRHDYFVSSSGMMTAAIQVWVPRKWRLSWRNVAKTQCSPEREPFLADRISSPQKWRQMASSFRLLCCVYVIVMGPLLMPFALGVRGGAWRDGEKRTRRRLQFSRKRRKNVCCRRRDARVSLVSNKHLDWYGGKEKGMKLLLRMNAA